MAESSDNKSLSIRARYISALVIMALYSFGFLAWSAKTNDTFSKIENLTAEIMELDRNTGQLANTAANLGELNPGFAANTLFGALEHRMELNAKLVDKVTATMSLFPTETRQVIYKATGNEEALFPSHDSIKDNVANLTKIAEAIRQNQTSFIDHKNQRQLIATNLPFNRNADIIANIYDGVIRNSTLEQLEFLQTKRQTIARENQNLNYIFAITSVMALLVIGLFIFRPMEKLINRQMYELNESNQAIQAADRAKSEFLANMSHEIRTPMNGVMGMAELLADSDLNPKQKMFTDIIVKSGSALLTIINDILDFSKLDAGQMELDISPFDLREAVEDVATLVSAKTSEKDIELIVRTDPNLPECLAGDVGRIRQVITNLVGNAVKFTERGHVYINVDCVIEDTSAKLRVAVEDTGTGIPEDKIDKVFEKFSQVDSSATRKHEGTGLGLSICSHLIELMDGDLGVHSKLGMGSTFWFEITLPIEKRAKTNRIVPVNVTGSRILIVDDNKVNRSILLEQMASWNFDAAAASSGREALMFLSEFEKTNMSIDGIILDYHMPDMSGGDTLKEIRAIDSMKHVPVIMLTSVDETEEGKNFSSLDIQGHLTKPARSSLLLETIISTLQASKQPEHNATLETTELPKTELRQQIFHKSSQEKQKQTGIDVLVCEDNEVNQIVFKQVLDKIGLNYRIANDGQEGLAMYRNFAPSLILMDVSMPRMNGHEATRTIREIEAKLDVHTPIIGVTAHAIRGDMERCFDVGMDDYLSKPISTKALSEKIHHWHSVIKSEQSAEA